MTDFNLGVVMTDAIQKSSLSGKEKRKILNEHKERMRQTVEKEKEEEKKMTEAGVSRREITEKRKNGFVFRGTSGGGGREKILRTRFREDGEQGKKGKVRYQKPQKGQTFFEEKIEGKEGNKMYEDRRRALRPEDTRSIALEKAAEQIVEAKAKPEGKESLEEYKKAKSGFDEILEAQRKNSPKTFSIRETRNAAFSVQSEVIRGEVNEDVLRVIAKAIKMDYLLVPIAVAVRNVRLTLINKGVSLAKVGVTDKADPQSLERLLIVLRENGLEKEREYLAGKMSYRWLQKMEARAARKLILDRKPELANWLPELALTRESELTREYVGKLLGALKVVGDSHYYRILTRSVEEGWRRPIKPKVETPSETVKKKDVVEEKSESTAVAKKTEEPKNVKKDAPVEVPKEKKDEPVKKTIEVKEAAPKKSPVTDETEIEKIEGLPALAASALKKKRFNTVGDLKEAPWELIEGTPKVGKKSLKILESLVKVKK